MQVKKVSIVNKTLAIVAGATMLGAIAPVRADITKSFIDQKDEMILGNSAAAWRTATPAAWGRECSPGADSGGGRKRSLMQFNIAGNIPAGVTITDVKLTMVLGQIAGTGSGTTGGSAIPTRTLNLFAVQQPWVEGLSGGIPGSNPPQTSPSIGGTGQGGATASPDSSWDYANFNSADPTTGKWNNGTNRPALRQLGRDRERHRDVPW